MSKALYTQMTVVITSLVLALAVGVTAAAADRWAQSQRATQPGSVRPDDRAGIRIVSSAATVSYPDVFERAVAAHDASIRRASDGSRGGVPWTTVGLAAAILALVAAIAARRIPVVRRVRERAA